MKSEAGARQGLTHSCCSLEAVAVAIPQSHKLIKDNGAEEVPGSRGSPGAPREPAPARILVVQAAVASTWAPGGEEYVSMRVWFVLGGRPLLPHPSNMGPHPLAWLAAQPGEPLFLGKAPSGGDKSGGRTSVSCPDCLSPVTSSFRSIHPWGKTLRNRTMAPQPGSTLPEMVQSSGEDNSGIRCLNLNPASEHGLNNYVIGKMGTMMVPTPPMFFTQVNELHVKDLVSPQESFSCHYYHHYF